jgi:hypothetical protein
VSVLIQGSQLRTIGLGTQVSRATATLPQSTTGTLFTVSGGRILLTSIVGEVTTAIQNQANNTKLVSTPTTGTAVDICAVLDIANDEAGCLYGITGIFSDAMVGANAGATTLQQRATVIPVGTIKLSCAASNTGSVKWVMTYIPLDDGASVAAA